MQPALTTARVSLPLLCLTLPLAAEEIRKAPNYDPLDADSSWMGGLAPTQADVAVWDEACEGITHGTLFSDAHWGGIRVLLSPDGAWSPPVHITGWGTLRLGAQGLDLSVAGATLDLNPHPALTLSLEANQVWNIGRAGLLQLLAPNGGGIGGLFKVGAGTLSINHFANASLINNGAQFGLAGGVVDFVSGAHAEVVGETFVYGDATRVTRTAGNSTLVMNNLTRWPGGTVDFAPSGMAFTSTANDSSENGGILGGWATVNREFWAQVRPGPGNQPVEEYPTWWYSVDFEADRNVNLGLMTGDVTLPGTTNLAVNSIRFDSDMTLTLGASGVFSLTNLSGGILMAGGANHVGIVSSSSGRNLRGPPGSDLVFHVPFLGQVLSSQAVIGVNSGSGLTKTGDGTLLLNPAANNTYAGLTTINGGVLQTGDVSGRRYVSTTMLINPHGAYRHGAGDNNLTATAITVNGGTLDLNGAGDACPALLLASDGLVTGYAPAKTFRVGNAATPLDARSGRVDARLDAPGGVVKTTDRRVRLTRDATLRDLRVERGELEISGDAQVTAGSLVLGDGTNIAWLILGGTNDLGQDTSGQLTITNLSLLNPPDPLLLHAQGIVADSGTADNRLILDLAHDDTLDLSPIGLGTNPYAHVLSVTKTGPGTLTVTGAIHFSHPLGVEGGVLRVGDATTVANRSVWLNGGALDVNAHDLDCFLLDWSGASVVSNSAFNPVVLRLSGSFRGQIMDGNGAVSLVLSSNRWMTLRGSNSYSGGTTVLPDGNLVMAETGVPGLGTLTLAGGIMWMDESLAVPVDNAIHLTTNSTLAPFFSYADEVTPEFTTHSFTATGGALRLENLRFQGSGLFEPRFSGSIHCDHPITMTNSGANRLRLGAFSTNGVFQNFVGGISGTGGFRRGAKAGLGGTTFLGGANTYTGETLVDNGTLILQGLLSGTNTVTVTNLGTLAGGGSVSGPVQVQAGGALSPGVAVGGPVARLTISNTLTLASGTTVQLRLSKADGTNDSVVGLSTVTYGGKLVVTNRAGDLAAGDAFKLFDAATYSGQFDAIEPATPGPGLVWDLTGLTNHGTLEVVAVRGPVIDTVTFHGAELVVSGSGGVPNGEYLILTATNAALAADLWWPLATNRFDGAGGFMFTTPVLLAEPDRYYRLASP